MAGLSAGDGGEEADLVAGVDWGLGSGEFLVHGAAHLAVGGEGGGMGGGTGGKVCHQGGDGSNAFREREVLAGRADLFAQPGEIEDSEGFLHAGSIAAVVATSSSAVGGDGRLMRVRR
jgi:hypothetical protein